MLIRTGLISCRHRVDGITNLGKGIISYRIHFVPASCKRGLNVVIYYRSVLFIFGVVLLRYFVHCAHGNKNGTK